MSENNLHGLHGALYVVTVFAGLGFFLALGERPRWLCPLAFIVWGACYAGLVYTRSAA